MARRQRIWRVQNKCGSTSLPDRTLSRWALHDRLRRPMSHWKPWHKQTAPSAFELAGAFTPSSYCRSNRSVVKDAYRVQIQCWRAQFGHIETLVEFARMAASKIGTAVGD